MKAMIDSLFRKSVNRSLQYLITAWRRMRPLLSRTIIVFVSNGILKASNAVLFIVVARWLGRTNAGYYSTATTLVAIALNVALIGLDEVLVRETARHHHDHVRWFANLMIARIGMTLLLSLILDAILLLAGLYSPELTFMILVLSIGQIGEGVLLLCQALFVSQDRVTLIFLIAVLISSLRLVVGFWLINAGSGLIQLILLLVVTSLIGAGFAIWAATYRVLRTTLGELMRHIRLTFIGRQLRQSGSFFGIGVFVIVEFQIDVVLLSILRSANEVALYSSAQMLIIAAWILPQAYRAVVYPQLSGALANGSNQFWAFYKTSVKISALLSICVCAAILLLSRFIIQILYPVDYGGSTIILQLFTLPLMFAFLAAPSSRAMLALHKEAAAAWFAGISMIINIVVNLALIPAYGSIGAVVARILSSAIFCLLTYIYLLKIRRGGGLESYDSGLQPNTLKKHAGITDFVHD